MNILITGALGQLGSELAVALRRRYGTDNVILSDLRDNINRQLVEAGPFELLDARDGRTLAEVVRKHGVGRIYHLAALLSATAEADPGRAWDININGLYTVLEVARSEDCSVFTPSSIGAFGPNTPKDYTPQDTMQRPTSMYGVTKVTGELLCDYYHRKYGVDTRGVRFPGIISNVTPPGGGTTDYAVEIYYEAVRKRRYECFLKGDTYLDMMYMPDAVKAAIDVMEADSSKLRHRNAFNVTAMSFSPEDQAAYIRKYIPDFEISYKVDPVRQALANSWPNSLEDYAARVEWGWEPEYDLDAMTRDMLETIQRRGSH
ncbi:MAG: NAD-dependent epimerase/dehydratase family protein [Spirochaetes bacterium]|jgi:nucleoside-diphosphate-sugar epimerase|nr:NAD-dependent epimerase/dehydratase family protein [Spirochaetota bacterium]